MPPYGHKLDGTQYSPIEIEILEDLNNPRPQLVHVIAMTSNSTANSTCVRFVEFIFNYIQQHLTTEEKEKIFFNCLTFSCVDESPYWAQRYEEASINHFAFLDDDTIEKEIELFSNNKQTRGKLFADPIEQTLALYESEIINEKGNDDSNNNVKKTRQKKKIKKIKISSSSSEEEDDEEIDEDEVKRVEVVEEEDLLDNNPIVNKELGDEGLDPLIPIKVDIDEDDDEEIDELDIKSSISSSISSTKTKQKTKKSKKSDEPKDNSSEIMYPFPLFDGLIHMWIESSNAYHLIDGQAMRETWGTMMPHILLSKKNLDAIVEQVKHALFEVEQQSVSLSPRMSRMSFSELEEIFCYYGTQKAFRVENGKEFYSVVNVK